MSSRGIATANTHAADMTPDQHERYDALIGAVTSQSDAFTKAGVPAERATGQAHHREDSDRPAGHPPGPATDPARRRTIARRPPSRDRAPTPEEHLMKLLITGATGTVGGALIQHLAGTRHHLRALVRNPAKAQLPDGVEIVQGDLTNPGDLRRALDGVDRAFLNMADDNGEHFAAVAGQLGLGHVVLLSSFTVTVPLPLGEDNVVTARHRAGEQALHAAGVPATLLRPAGFYTSLLAWTSALADSVVRAPYLDVALPVVDPDDVAASAAAVLLADAPPAAAFSITGPKALTVRDQTRILGDLLGRELRTEQITEQQAKDTALPAGTPDHVAASILATASPAAAALPVSGDVQQLTGRGPRTFQRWTTEHATAFG